MIKNADRWERWIKGWAIGSVVLLAAVQTATFHSEIRLYLSQVDRLEGETINHDLAHYTASPSGVVERTVVTAKVPVFRQSRTIIIRMIQPKAGSNIYVMINGEKAADFGRGDVHLTVFDGDYVEIDCSAADQAARFAVRVPAGGLVLPVDGLLVDQEGSVASIRKIKFRQ